MAEELARLRAVADRLQAMIGTESIVDDLVDEADPVAMALSARYADGSVVAEDAALQPVD